MSKLHRTSSFAVLVAGEAVIAIEREDNANTSLMATVTHSGSKIIANESQTQRVPRSGRAKVDKRRREEIKETR